MTGGRSGSAGRARRSSVAVLALWVALLFVQEARGKPQCAATKPLGSNTDANCEVLCSEDTLESLVQQANETSRFCRPEDCYCRLNSAGIREEVSIQTDSARCFAFQILDRHHFLSIDVASSLSSLEGYVTTGTGPEEEPRFVWNAAEENATASPSFVLPTYDVFSLSRETWRAEEAKKDEGEWEGDWSLCLRAPQSNATASTRAHVTINGSRCPFDDRGLVCGGPAMGMCNERKTKCATGVAPECSEYYCLCNPGYAGSDCSIRWEAPLNPRDDQGENSPAPDTTDQSGTAKEEEDIHGGNAVTPQREGNHGEGEGKAPKAEGTEGQQSESQSSPPPSESVKEKSKYAKPNHTPLKKKRPSGNLNSRSAAHDVNRSHGAMSSILITTPRTGHHSPLHCHREATDAAQGWNWLHPAG